MCCFCPISPSLANSRYNPFRYYPIIYVIEVGHIDSEQFDNCASRLFRMGCGSGLGNEPYLNYIFAPFLHPILVHFLSHQGKGAKPGWGI